MGWRRGREGKRTVDDVSGVFGGGRDVVVHVAGAATTHLQREALTCLRRLKRAQAGRGGAWGQRI